MITFLIFSPLNWDPDLILKVCQVWPRTFFRKIKKIPAKIWLFLTIKAINIDTKNKIKFCKKSFSSFHHKWNKAWLLVTNWFIRVASWVVKQLKVNKSAQLRQRYHKTLSNILLQVSNHASKSGSHFPKKCFICLNDSPSKMMKNVFYFNLKALFVLKIFKLLSWLFAHGEKTAWLER